MKSALFNNKTGQDLITVPHLHTLDISNNNAKAQLTLFMEEQNFYTGLSGSNCELVDALDDDPMITVYDDAWYDRLTNYGFNGNGDSYTLLMFKNNGINYIDNMSINESNVVHNNGVDAEVTIANAHTRQKSGVIYNPIMKLRHLHCSDNGLDLTDPEILLEISNKESLIKWYMYSTINLSYNNLTDTYGLKLLKMALPIVAPLRRKKTEKISLHNMTNEHNKQNIVDNQTKVLNTIKKYHFIPVIYNIRNIDLSYTNIGNNCVEYLKQLCCSEHLKNLKYINLNGNVITQVGFESFFDILIPIAIPIDTTIESLEKARNITNKSKKERSVGDTSNFEETDQEDNSMFGLISSLSNPFKKKKKKTKDMKDETSKAIAKPILNNDQSNIPKLPPISNKNKSGSETEQGHEINTNIIHNVKMKHQLPYLTHVYINLNPLQNKGLLTIVKYLMKGALDRLLVSTSIHIYMRCMSYHTHIYKRM